LFPLFKGLRFKRVFDVEPPKDADPSPEDEHIIGLIIKGLQERLNQAKLRVAKLKGHVLETDYPVEGVVALKFLDLARKEEEADDQELRRACELAVHFGFYQQVATTSYSQLSEIEAEDR